MPNIETAVKFMETIAADDSHGYSQVHRTGNPDYDCSSLVGTALHNAGFNVSATSTTRTLHDQLIKCGFKEIGINEARKRGDIFLSPGHHVVMCTDANYICHASIDENGTTKGTTPGDQKGNEICKRAFYYPSYGWTYHLRYSSTSINYTVGVDVSEYQGNVDWTKVKAAGVSFAILKVCKKDGTVEPKFEENYKNAIAAGVKIQGVYNYSYATTVQKAQEDAKKVLKILGERAPMIYIDVEDKCLKGLGQTLIDIILAYKNVVEASNCQFGIYTGLSFYDSYLKPYLGQISSIPVWVARYGGSNNGTYNESYKPSVSNMNIWQYTSKGSIAGISGYVDMDVMFKNVTTTTTTTETPILVMCRTTTNLNVRTQPNTSSSIVKVAKKGTFLQLTAECGDWYKTTDGYVSKKYVEYLHGKVTANKLYIRSTPDKTIDTNKIDVLTKDTEVIICTAQGEWYHVLLSDNRTGWVSGKYLEII